MNDNKAPHIWVLIENEHREVMTAGTSVDAVKRYAERREGRALDWRYSDSHGRMWSTPTYSVQQTVMVEPWFATVPITRSE
jgi:hypothetical protein